jgi:microcystin-dependent protein
MNSFVEIARMISDIRFLYNKNRIHVGDYKYSARSNDCDSWLVCDGRALTRDKFPELYSIIGTSFGSPSSSTFNLPDFRGRAIAAISSVECLGTTEGSKSIVLTTDHLPSHSHSGSTHPDGSHGHMLTDPGHTHTLETNQDDFNMSGGPPPSFGRDAGTPRVWNNVTSSGTGITVNSGGMHTHSFDTSSVGSAAQLSLVQPTTFGGNVLIYTGR